MKKENMVPIISSWLNYNKYAPVFNGLRGLDFFGKKGEDSIIIMSNSSLTSKLLESAYKEREYATEVYIAIPERDGLIPHPFYHYLTSFGIGVIYVNLKTRRCRVFLKAKKK